MKYLAAYLLLLQGGNESPSASEIKNLIESVGIESDESRVSALLSSLKDKSIENLVVEGQAKLAFVPAGGAPVSGGAATGVQAASSEQVAEEPAEETKEESDDDMGFGLFD